ncbi:MAG TPA: hypothetical protein VI758_11060 [Bacteroidota bacterium]
MNKAERSANRAQPAFAEILVRGMRMRCPRCSRGRLYDRWNVFKKACEYCGYGFEEREGNCWFFLYSTTAALTGIFIILILLWKPGNLFLGRLVLGVASICIIVFTLPVRKGVALALEFLSEQKGGTILLYDDEKDLHS